jgi:hypothetical protein
MAECDALPRCRSPRRWGFSLLRRRPDLISEGCRQNVARHCRKQRRRITLRCNPFDALGNDEGDRDARYFALIEHN